MRIAVIGTGNVGATLAKRWLSKDHQIVFGTRDPQSQRITELMNELTANGKIASAVTIAEVAQDADAVVLAVPWMAALESVEALGDLDNKVLIDATNPIEMTPEGLQAGLTVGHSTSAAELIAEKAQNARVVKAFNQAGVGIMGDESISAEQCTLFICGDDDEAKRVVAALGKDLNYRVIDAGSLRQARLLEPLGMLWIHLCYLQGMGPNFCFSVSDI